MLQRIKNIHPGWFIGRFFALLIGFNVVFFVIAAVTPVQLVPRNAPARAAALQPDAGAPGAHRDAVAPNAPAPRPAHAE